MTEPIEHPDRAKIDLPQPVVAAAPSAFRIGVARIAMLPLLLLALTLFAIYESGTVIASDDFGYLMWGLLAHGQPLAWVSGPDWLSYHRPLNALVWWLSARTGVEGDAIRYANVALWLTGAAALVIAPGRRETTVVALALVATNQISIDVLTWRSWLTTSGSTCLLILGLVAVEKQAHPAIVAGLAFAAMGFKEMSPLALSVICLFTPRYRSVGVLVWVWVGIASMASTHKIGVAFLLENLHFHVGTVALFAPVIPLVVARRWPDAPWWALLTTTVVVWVPSPVAAGAVCLAAALALRERRAWLCAFVIAWLLPQFGAAHARQYLLEGWFIVALAIVLDTSRLRWTAIIAAFLLGLPSALDFERHRAQLRAKFTEQRAFLHVFSPPIAKILYAPDPMWAYDLDALWWVERGATLEGAPPPGAKPKQLGPRSGVWADLQDNQGSGTR